MHPVLVTLPGWLFKLLVPALLAWSAYSLATRARLARRVAEAAVEAPPRELAATRADTVPGALVTLSFALGLFAYAAPLPAPGPDASALARSLHTLAALPATLVRPDAWRAPWSPLPLYAYGLLLGLSLVVGWALSLRLAVARGVPRERAVEWYLVSAFCAVAGSRALYVATNLREFYDPEAQRWLVAQMFALRNGGLVAYGGFLGGLAGAYVYARRNALPLLRWADAAAPSLAAGLAITRVGCFLYGCDFGRPLEPGAPAWLRALGTFPRWDDTTGSPAWRQHVEDGLRTTEALCYERFHGAFERATGRCRLDLASTHSAAVHPTQLYEALLGAALLLALRAVWRRRRYDGQVFYAFGALYGLARAALEVLRDDAERGFWLGASTSQWLGALTGVLCVALYLRGLTAARDAAERASGASAA